MNLTFNEIGTNYVAEFEATADFALHIERSGVGDIQLLQNTGSSHGYARVEDFHFDNRNKLVIDYDAPVLIPKRIKVVSEVEPTYAAVTSAGEVTEIKSQDKEVEVTSNGTIDVTPDAGFAYLNKVSVKTNVAQSGEGGGSGNGGGGSASSWRYFSVPESANSNPAMVSFLLLTHNYKVISNGGTLIGGGSLLNYTDITITAVGIDMSQSVAEPSLGIGNQVMSINEVFNMDMGGVTGEQMFVQMLGISEITEEEFYTL